MISAVVHLSVAVQFGIVVLVAVFYLVLSRSVRLEEAQVWSAAWVANAVALAGVLVVSLMHPPDPWARVALGAYALGKTLFAVLLLVGARYHQLPASVPERPVGVALILCLAWSTLLVFLSPQLLVIQTGQTVMVAGLLTVGGIWMLRRSLGRRSRWLGYTVLLEGTVFVHHAVVLVRSRWLDVPLPTYTSYSSFLDAGVELLIALAALVALHERTAEELRWANRSLVSAQERLRELVDQDPLTALSNRRRLNREMSRLEKGGASVVFLDLDGFKAINDRLGHAVGDACLRRAARLLVQSFRQEDLVFRWGGDEFLIVAPGLDPEGVRERLEQLRRLMVTAEPGVPGCDFSHGITTVTPGGSLRAAIAEADRRMYAAKRGEQLPESAETVTASSGNKNILTG